MGLPVSRNLSIANSCLPLVDRVLAPSTFQTWLVYPLSGVRTPRCGVAKVVKFYKTLVMLITASQGITNHWLNLFEDAFVVQQSNCISCNQTSQRIPSDAEFLNIVAIFLQFLQSCFDFICNTLATKLNAIIGEAARVAFGYEDVEIRVSFSNSGGKILQMFRIAPKPVCYQLCALLWTRWGS